MNSTIYLNTLKKIVKHKFVIALIFISIFMVPFASLDVSETFVKTTSIRDCFLNAFVLGMLILTLTSPFPSPISMSGRMDYMPLIVVRPLPRWKYVVSKWLALSTVISGTVILQQFVFIAINAFQALPITPEIILCSLLDRLLIGMNMSAVLTLVYILPSELAILVGILAVQVAAATHVFPVSLGIPITSTADNINLMVMEILELDTFASEKILPVVLGGISKDSIDNYITLFKMFAQFFAPDLHTYDLFTARPIYLTPLLEVLSNCALSLFLASVMLNSREFHYDTD